MSDSTTAMPQGLAAYAGLASTPQAAQTLAAYRYFPYKFASQAIDGDAALPAYDTGGSIIPGDTSSNSLSSPSYDWNQQELIDLGLAAPNNNLSDANASQANQGQGNSPNPGGNGNWGGTNMGGAGIAPASMSMGDKLASAGLSLGMGALGIGGMGAVTGIGNATNSAINAAQANEIAQATGQPTANAAQIAGNMIGLGTAPTAAQAASTAATAMANSNPSAVANTPSTAQILGIASQLSGNPTAMSNILGNPGLAAAYGAPGPMSLGAPLASGLGGAVGGGQNDPTNTNAAGVNSDLGGMYANGGGIQGAVRPFNGTHFLRLLARGSGLVHGNTGGRADAVKASLPRGGYIIPADVVSGIGQGNTLAGGKHIGTMLSGLKKRGPSFARGGAVGDQPHVKIRISAGEYFIHPHHVAALGGGNLAAGQSKLDALVQHVRGAAVRHALTAPPPR